MNFKVPVLVVIVLSLGFVSCKKGDDTLSTSVTRTTTLNVVNATTDTLNYYLNGSRVNTTSSLYPFGYTGYLDVNYADQKYQFKHLGNTDVLFNLVLALDTNKVYSLFVAGRAEEHTFTTLDTLISDTNGKAKIRFVNASPDAGNLDVLIDSLKLNMRPYKSATVFVPIGVGIKHVQIFQSGSTTAISDSTRTFVTGRVYTLFSRGSITGTGGQKFGTGLVVNR